MTYIKIDGTLYPAAVNGRLRDNTWDGRDSKYITLTMSHDTADLLFVDDIAWSIVQQDGEEEQEFDNSDYCLAGDITDHRDGTITVKMGKYTDLELALLV